MKVTFLASLFLFLLVSCSSSEKVETKSIAASVVKKKSSGPVTLVDQYQAHMKNFPSEKKLDSCEVNFKSHRNLRRNQKNIFMNNPQMAITNFNGIYLLLESPISMGSEWFVVNCKTGKYETTLPLAGDIIFDADSKIIVTKPFNYNDTLKTFHETAYGLPLIFEWSNNKWVTLENPIQSKAK